MNSNKDAKEIIPLAVLVLLIILSVKNLFVSGFKVEVTLWHLAGIVLLASNIVFYFKDRKTYMYILGVTLLLASFTPLTFYFEAHGMRSSFFHNTVPFWDLILYSILFYKRIIGAFIDMGKRDVDEEIRLEAKRKSRFKDRFIHLSNAEIEAKLQTDLVADAKEALLEIQAERKLATSTE